MKRRVSRKRKQKPALSAGIGAVVLAGLLMGAFLRCRPILIAFAENKARWLASKIANQTVEAVLAENGTVCRQMLCTHYTSDSTVTAVTVDTAAVNQVRTAVVHGVMEALKPYASLSVGIPLGTLAGLDCLSGWGPLITFPMSTSASVVSDVSSQVEEAGINQSAYRLTVHLDIRLYVVTPGGRSSVQAEYSYPMAETVILGQVPDSFTQVHGDDQTVLDQIFDYGSQN